MSDEGFQLPLAEGRALHVHRWPPAAAPRGVLLVVHGMAEHGARYARLAAAANAEGWAVVAPDLPGHGLTADAAARGHFADRDGWACALAAVHALRRHVQERHSALPLVVLGHSMGSFLAQHYLVEHGEGLAGAILSATSGSLGPLRPVGWLLMKAEAALLGARHPSALAETLSFKRFNQAFEPARTAFDWLSRDPLEVDRYLADPLCGFRCSATLWSDLFAAGASLGDGARLARIPKALPLLLICGSVDPVSQGRAGPERLAAAYRAAGIGEVGVRVYEQGRHELLNDVCRDEVTADLLGWLRLRLR
ncbi:MAG: alpha/beta hydrolase [Nevskia sp.]